MALIMVLKDIGIMGLVLWGFLSMHFLCICLEFLKSIPFGCYIEMQIKVMLKVLKVYKRVQVKLHMFIISILSDEEC